MAATVWVREVPIRLLCDRAAGSGPVDHLQRDRPPLGRGRHTGVAGFLVQLLPVQVRHSRSRVEPPDCPVGLILAVNVLAVAGFFGYQQLVKPAPTTLNASDNSFTVRVPPGWRAEAPRVPPGWRQEDLERLHIASMGRLYVTSASHDRNMSVTAHPAGSLTLQQWGQSVMYGAVHVAHAEVDPGGSLQPTAVGGEPALRTTYTVPGGPTFL